MSFIEGEADHLIAVDERGNVREFRHRLGPPLEGPSESVQRDRLEKTRDREPVAGAPDSAGRIPFMHQFSKNGRTLACVKHLRVERDQQSSSAPGGDEQLRTCVELNRFTRELRNRIDITVSDAEHCTPILSKNGKSLLAPTIHRNHGDGPVGDPRLQGIWVLPEVDFWEDEQNLRMLRGESAFWDTSGEMAFVWDVDDVGRPRLSAYDTKSLGKSSKTDPKLQLTLRGGLESWRAQELKGRANGDRARDILIIQQSSKTRSFLVWNVETDTVTEEVTVPLNPLRPKLEERMSYPQTSARSNADLNQRALSKSASDLRAVQDAQPMFCTTEDGIWIGIVDGESGSGSLCCIRTGTAVWDFHASELKITGRRPTFEQVAFDAANRLLIFAGNKILVFSPPFLSTFRSPQNSAGDGIRHLDIGMSSSERLELPAGYSCLPSKALMSACEKNASAEKDFFGFPLRMEENEQLVDATLSVDRDLLALLVEKPDGSSFTRTCITRGNASLNTARFPDLEFPQVIESSGDVFSPQRIFIFRDNQGNEQLVLLSVGRNPMSMWSDLDDGPGELKELQMDLCLHISRSNDLQTLALLGENEVRILDLQTRKTINTVPYSTNFSQTIEIMEESMRWQDAETRGLQSVTDRRIADDGTAVLLAWDTRNAKSIVVTHDMKQDECGRLIDNADQMLSQYCQLSPNGECTLFVDIENFSKGTAAIGFFNQQSKINLSLTRPINATLMHIEQETAHSIHVERRLCRDMEESDFPGLCSNISYGLSADQTQLIVQLLSVNRSSGSVLPNRFKIFTVNAIAECAGNYEINFRRESSVNEYIDE